MPKKSRYFAVLWNANYLKEKAKTVADGIATALEIGAGAIEVREDAEMRRRHYERTRRNLVVAASRNVADRLNDRPIREDFEDEYDYDDDYDDYRDRRRSRRYDDDDDYRRRDRRDRDRDRDYRRYRRRH